MKILLVHNAYQQPGGEDTVFENECRLLRRFGHDVITYERSNHEVSGYTGIRRAGLVKDIIWNSHSRRDFTQLLKQGRPDIVHAHNTFMIISPAIYAACGEAGVPVVQTLHNYRLLCPASTFFRDGQVCEECVTHSLARGIAHACYHESALATATVACMLKVHRMLGTWQSAVNIYVALSEFSRQRFIAGGLPEAKIAVKPNFVAPDPGSRRSAGRYALFVGRLSGEKGLLTLLEAWKHTAHVPLVVVGDGPLRPQLQARAEKLKIQNVVFRGRLTRSEVDATIKDATFLVQPSECYENFPMTVVEAFACGVPVLCSRIGALQEIVSDEVTGLQFTPGDAEDLAEKVEWAWQHHEATLAMGKRARREFETKYTAEQNYKYLTELYQRVLTARLHREGPAPVRESTATEAAYSSGR
jgi:glycosyltransferase involved in cell wall biosynthesis